MAMDDTAIPACSPTRVRTPVATVTPACLHTALEGEQGIEGMHVALSLPQHSAACSASDLQDMHGADSVEDGATPGHVPVRCSSVGDFECAGLATSDSDGAGEGGSMGVAQWRQGDVSRRWLLMQRHVQVLGLERKLRRGMWQDLMHVALSRSATPSKEGDAEGAPEPTTERRAEHAEVGRAQRTGRAVSVDAEDAAGGRNRFIPRGRRSMGDKAAAASCPASPHGKKNWPCPARDRIGLAAF